MRMRARKLTKRSLLKLQFIGLWIYSIFGRIELEFVEAEVVSSQPQGGIEASHQIEPETL